jgi:hypothetical protein
VITNSIIPRNIDILILEDMKSFHECSYLALILKISLLNHVLNPVFKLLINNIKELNNTISS